MFSICLPHVWCMFNMLSAGTCFIVNLVKHDVLLCWVSDSLKFVFCDRNKWFAHGFWTTHVHSHDDSRHAFGSLNSCMLMEGVQKYANSHTRESVLALTSTQSTRS